MQLQEFDKSDALCLFSFPFFALQVEPRWRIFLCLLVLFVCLFAAAACCCHMWKHKGSWIRIILSVFKAVAQIAAQTTIQWIRSVSQTVAPSEKWVVTLSPNILRSTKKKGKKEQWTKLRRDKNYCYSSHHYSYIISTNTTTKTTRGTVTIIGPCPPAVSSSRSRKSVGTRGCWGEPESLICMIHWSLI